LTSIEEIRKVIAPVTFDPTVKNYSDLVETIDRSVRQQALDMMGYVLEQADMAFRRGTDRTQRYYVTNTRSRTIITIFGDLEYRRTEYVDRNTKKPFIYIDEKLGLNRRCRYDPCVCSMIYELYSDHNSMIKVGKIVGGQIHPFNVSEDPALHAIPRQTVQKVLLRFRQIIPAVPREKETPDTLFIMSDEKYIPLQGEKKNSEESAADTLIDGEVSSFKGHNKAMTKIAVAFDGREQLVKKNGELQNRWVLLNKHIFTYPDDTKHFWKNVYTDLARLYDLDKIKNIYVMGDGAAWIKAGTQELQSQYSSVKYAADRFHCEKAIHRLSKDKDIRKLLSQYANKGMKKDFMKLAEAIKEDSSLTAASFDQTANYIANQVSGLKVMNQEVKIGCSMEQAIQHILASTFTSVPKAYGRNHLHTYVSARTAQQNGFNMKALYLQAMDVFGKTGSTSVDFNEVSLDLSLFDSKKTDPYYHNSLNDIPTVHEQRHS
jgi:hypothetical protein